jgi:hypothetical protein
MSGGLVMNPWLQFLHDDVGVVGCCLLQIGGLQIQGAAFDGNRLTTVTQVGSLTRTSRLQWPAVLVLCAATSEQSGSAVCGAAPVDMVCTHPFQRDHDPFE